MTKASRILNTSFLKFLCPSETQLCSFSWIKKHLFRVGWLRLTSKQWDLKSGLEVRKSNWVMKKAPLSLWCVCDRRLPTFGVISDHQKAVSTDDLSCRCVHKHQRRDAGHLVLVPQLHLQREKKGWKEKSGVCGWRKPLLMCLLSCCSA